MIFYSCLSFRNECRSSIHLAARGGERTSFLLHHLLLLLTCSHETWSSEAS
ncbi:hypothetical protein V3C99_001163, partial [Haemonchus contortus]